jgi:Flp pilus assembly protein TadG
MCNQRQSKRGQAIVMVTFALFAMVGLMGLAVDFGWAFFVKKAAQRAADSAALAAVKASFVTINQSGPFTCTTNPCPNNAPCMVCQPTPQSCSGISAGSNLFNGCQYAAQNGFSTNARQTVRLVSDVTTPFNTRTGPVATHYWVTATVAENVPQLFSAILGNGLATVAATATAAIVDITVPGTLIVLNHRNDRTAMGQVPGGQTQYGVNLLVQANDNQGQYALQTQGGIRLSSDCGPNTGWDSDTCSNGNNQNFWAGENQGGGTIFSPETRIRGDGWYHNQGSARWIQTPTNGHSSGFDDPMAGKGQPPPKLASQSWTPYPVPGGVINPVFCESLSGVTGECPPGQYFRVDTPPSCNNCQQMQANGQPLQIQGDVRFTAGGGGFGNYVFYGGLTGGNQTTAWFEPGIYVLAGARAGNNAPGVVLDTSTNFTMRDATSGNGANSDAGMLFIMTDGTYGGRIPPPVHSTWVTGLEDSLQYGTASLQSGNNDTYINLHGLNPDHATIQGEPSLSTFAPTLIWWDQNNSSVFHDSNGNVVCSDAAQNNCDTNTVQNGRLDDVKSPELQFQASPAVNLYGVVYQPRGAWTTMVGGGGYSGPVQLITGALQVKASSNVNLVVPESTLTITIVTLIQ